ncbi:aflU [Aspergillus flavus]|uniref:AflU n=1 Tax=Aspergillus flavus (strain ATCC 200026 / FGSC A1120 / IAM 13836 / NRRL 3357 / JCM 12722 / SRRC 167) TaxID=332952 RepID=A0A7U2MNI8_ASPFN|nr:aflU [Aspergillus flavus]
MKCISKTRTITITFMLAGLRSRTKILNSRRSLFSRGLRSPPSSTITIGYDEESSSPSSRRNTSRASTLTSDLTTHYVYGTNLKFSRSRISKMTFSRAWTAWIPGSPCYSSSGVYQKTLLQAMATADVPEEEKTATRLQMETLNIIAGGTETTARALAVGVFHLAHKPSLLLQLRDELRTVMPFPDSLASCTQLEQLPYSYLAGVVNESLRLAFGFIIRPARVYPNDPLVNEDLTPISQSAYFVCMDPSIFSQPDDFNPDRWVQAARDGNKLHRYLIVLSKGSRHCLGINFALAEIYLAIATVARRFDLVPYQTTVEQLQMKRDLGFTAPEKGPFTVRAKVTGLAD